VDSLNVMSVSGKKVMPLNVYIYVLTAVHYTSSKLMCTGVKDICNTIMFSTSDPKCFVSSVMFNEFHISGCNIYTSINSVTHVFHIGPHELL
jgi:hypothetical protein